MARWTKNLKRWRPNFSITSVQSITTFYLLNHIDFDQIE